MFESDLLDRLSRVHPMVPLVIFVPAITALRNAAYLMRRQAARAARKRDLHFGFTAGSQGAGRSIRH